MKSLWFWVALLVGIGLRLGVRWSWGPLLERRIEIASPLSSYWGVKEGFFLRRFGSASSQVGFGEEESPSSYAGPLCRHPPLLMSFLEVLGFGDETYRVGSDDTLGSVERVDFVFVVFDLILVFLLDQIVHQIGKEKIQNFKKEKGEQKGGGGKKKINSTIWVRNGFRDLVCLSFFLFPLSILSCAGRSITIVRHLCVALSLLFALKGGVALSSLFGALFVSLSFSSLGLICPLMLILYHYSGQNYKLPLVYLFFFLLFSASLLYLSYLQQDQSFSFLKSTFLFQILSPDLRPNIGLIWYLSAEMFEQFRHFFTFAIQYHLLLYPIPLTIRFSQEPIFLFYFILSISCVFCAYPTISDLSLPVAMLPLFVKLIKDVKHLHAMGIAVCVSFFLGPVFWKLWMQESGNANFFYVVTLIWAGVQVFFLSQMARAALFCQYRAKHGLPLKRKRGEVNKEKRGENENENENKNAEENTSLSREK